MGAEWTGERALRLEAEQRQAEADLARHQEMLEVERIIEDRPPLNRRLFL
jgi:hypothetical protein